jgi:hypothetical protein
VPSLSGNIQKGTCTFSLDIPDEVIKVVEVSCGSLDFIDIINICIVNVGVNVRPGFRHFDLWRLEEEE